MKCSDIVASSPDHYISQLQLHSQVAIIGLASQSGDGDEIGVVIIELNYRPLL